MKTLATYYCEQPQMLEDQIECWLGYPADVLSGLEIVVVDDCSQCRPAADVLRGTGLPVRVFRLLAAVPWNFPGVRNLAVDRARGEDVFMFDIDHLVPATTAAHFIATPVAAQTFVVARRLEGGAAISAHEHCQAVRREDFADIIGGYDEDWSGYNGDGVFLPRRDAYLTRSDDEALVVVHVPNAGVKKWARHGRDNVLRSREPAYRRALAAMARPQRSLRTPWKEVTP